MQIQTNVPLAGYSTMRLGGPARALCNVTNEKELVSALSWAKAKNLPTLILGGSSNVIFSDGFDGLVIINAIKGFEVVKSDSSGATLRIGAGEIWDEVVEKSVQMNLHGIEFLSAIPGTAGATPVQNVGAYGAEIADVFVELRAFDLAQEKFVTMQKADCHFSYRNSIFKPTQNRRYIITSLTLRLSTQMPKPPFYASLELYFKENGIKEFTPNTVRQAVVAIRSKYLPDPSVLANTGSFFKNPIVTAAQADTLIKSFPHIQHWPMPDGQVKLAAGWLVEEAGLKGYEAHGFRTHQHHSLVVINSSATSYSQLKLFKQEIISRVQAKFGVTLEQEPELW